MSRAAGRSWVVVALGVVSILLTACSGVPYFPGRLFEPSPTPAIPTPSPSTPSAGGATPADVDLLGRLRTEKGATISVGSQFWFGTTTTAPIPDHAGDGEWVSVHVGFSGRTTVTNEGEATEAAAGSVLYEYNAGWAATSPTCRLLRGGDDPAFVRGGYCWRRLGSASLLDPQLRLLHRLQPGEQRTMTIAADPAPAGLTAEVPVAKVGPVGRALARPEVLVVTTSDALRDATQADVLRGTCTEAQAGPDVGGGSSGQTQPPSPPVHAIVAMTTPLKCVQLPPLSD